MTIRTQAAQEHFERLCRKEGWDLEEQDGGKKIVVVGERIFEVTHPYAIHLIIYRDSVDVGEKLYSMRRIHDLLWPDHALTWNHWTERRFLAHCEGFSQIVMAGGAGVGKSSDAAKIGLIFWLSDPKHNACIVASTTLESLEARIWGYVAKFFHAAAVPIAGVFLRSKPPKILYPGKGDKIHGMFAIAMSMSIDDTVLANVIGRHPDKRMMMILDEATDMNPSIIKALPNLEKSVELFQLWAIGNSRSKNDLHGALATPRVGWDKIDPARDYAWETMHENSICLYFNPYDSPAIREEDPAKKRALEKFLMTSESIARDLERYGGESDSFLRFVMGFWPSQDIDNVALSEPFLTENQVSRRAEWSGFYELAVVAGLDPAFQVGGSGCLLRLALLGHTTNGDVVLDFRGEELVFRLNIQLNSRVSGERQLCEQTLEILAKYRVPLRALALDATGVGRALGELLRTIGGFAESPNKVVSVRPMLKAGNTDPFVKVLSPIDIWLMFREFVQRGQIRGIDELTQKQLVNRLVTRKEAGGKLLLETKKEYKARMQAINPRLAHSPDESDAAMLAMLSAIWTHGFAVGQKRTLPDTKVGHFWLAKEQAYRAELARAEESERLAMGGVGGDSQNGTGLPPLVADFSGTLEDVAGTSSAFSSRRVLRD